MGLATVRCAVKRRRVIEMKVTGCMVGGWFWCFVGMCELGGEINRYGTVKRARRY